MYIIRLFKDVSHDNGTLHNKKIKRSKKTPTVIEIEAFGCMPASAVDCISSNKNVHTVR